MKKGQVLATLDSIQSAADVAAMQSTLNASKTDALAAQAAVNTAVADLNQSQAEYERAKLDYERNKALYEQQLIAKSDFDSKKAAFGTSTAQVEQAKAKLAQAKANNDSAEVHISQSAATLRRVSDVLSKTEYEAPFDGVITNLPVREGETVVMGIQNAPGSTLMTIADTSIITAEVKVDESDIVNVQAGQPAEVSVDAFPNQKFKGDRHRDRPERGTAFHRRLNRADHDQRPGGQRLQSRRGFAESAAESSSRTLGDSAHYHRQA